MTFGTDQRWIASLFYLSILATAPACGESRSGQVGSGDCCILNQTQLCFCPDGRQGARQCLDGVHFTGVYSSLRVKTSRGVLTVRVKSGGGVVGGWG
jgi:hypothetical protein